VSLKLSLVLSTMLFLSTHAAHAQNWAALSQDYLWDERSKKGVDILKWFGETSALSSNTLDYSTSWKVSRMAYYAGFFLATEANQKDLKKKIFEVGVDAGKRARTSNPEGVEGHYWFAISQGGWGVANGIMSSLGSAKEMKQALDKAIAVDPSYHFGGPLRVRGRMYFKLPGGIISFGDNKKALADLRKAVELGPQSKLNYVYLAEVVAKLQNKSEGLKLVEHGLSLADVVGEKEEAAYKRDLLELKQDWAK
jgi:tetratricopeptide (TPR) repeat protein